jgi:hypothetical protein
VVGDARVSIEPESEIPAHGVIFEEVSLDVSPSMAQRQNEIRESLSSVDLHHVPKDRTTADSDQHLGLFVTHADA